MKKQEKISVSTKYYLKNLVSAEFKLKLKFQLSLHFLKQRRHLRWTLPNFGSKNFFMNEVTERQLKLLKCTSLLFMPIDLIYFLIVFDLMPRMRLGDWLRVNKLDSTFCGCGFESCSKIRKMKVPGCFKK